MNDITRIKQILRTHNLHERECAKNTQHISAQCDCWLSQDPFDLEKDPPMRIDEYRTADTRQAERSRRHIYPDGSTRSWTSHFGGPWTENTQQRNTPCA